MGRVPLRRRFHYAGAPTTAAVCFLGLSGTNPPRPPKTDALLKTQRTRFRPQRAGNHRSGPISSNSLHDTHVGLARLSPLTLRFNQPWRTASPCPIRAEIARHIELTETFARTDWAILVCRDLGRLYLPSWHGRLHSNRTPPPGLDNRRKYRRQAKRSTIHATRSLECRRSRSVHRMDGGPPSLRRADVRSCELLSHFAASFHGWADRNPPLLCRREVAHLGPGVERAARCSDLGPSGEYLGRIHQLLVRLPLPAFRLRGASAVQRIPAPRDVEPRLTHEPSLAHSQITATCSTPSGSIRSIKQTSMTTPAPSP